MENFNTGRWDYERDTHAYGGVLPDLIQFGFDNPRKAIELKDHRHPNAYEFVFIEKGHASWEVNSNQYETKTGDVFHTWPGEMHRGGYDVIEPCRLWWLVLEVPPLEETSVEGWMGLSSAEAESLLTGLLRLPRVTYSGRIALEPLRRLRQAIEEKGDLHQLECRVSLLDFLLLVLRPNSQRTLPNDVLMNLKAITEEMTERPYWRPSVSELARRTAVSEAHFFRIFKDYTGMTPIAYSERIRIGEACRRLKDTDDAVTHIAISLGYATSQHFATVFRRIIGQTPSQWRQG